MHPGVIRAQSAIGGFRGDRVEHAHRLRKMHGVVEPEALIILLAELHVIGISRLCALGAGDDMKRTRKRKAPGLDRGIHKAVTLYTGLALLIGLFSRFVSIDEQNP